MTAGFRLGTRGSRLAVIQAELVAARLRAEGHRVELVRIVTTGDRRPAGMSAQDGWFTRVLREALETGDLDLAVHSAKDLPIEEEPATALLYPERADPRDALLTRARVPLAGLPAGAVVGTDSTRRAGFLAAARPDLRFVPLHGNVTTRLQKLERGDADALVLALAGLDRLGLGPRVDEVLDPSLVAPAPAQGALAIEVLRLDSPVGEAVSKLDDPAVRATVEAERAVLKAMGGGCRSPLGALAELVDGNLSLLAGLPGTVLRRTAPAVEQRALIEGITRDLRQKKEEESWQPR